MVAKQTKRKEQITATKFKTEPEKIVKPNQVEDVLTETDNEETKQKEFSFCDKADVKEQA